VNKSPFTNTTLDECARFASDGSPILLIEDGVYAAMAGTGYEPRLKEIMVKHEVYALAPDLKARGVDHVTAGVKTVGYEGFVELVEQHKTHTWV